MKKLQTGTNLIRMFLVVGIILSLAGIVFSTVPSLSNQILLPVVFLLNIVVMAAIIRILTVRKLPFRIKQISLAMNKAAEGKLTERVVIDGETEISQLAVNFNSMMEMLAGAIIKVHLSLKELKNISLTIEQLSEKGVASATVQSETLKRTTFAIREIDHSITDISTPIVILASLSSDNSTAMTELSQSLQSTTQSIEFLAISVEEVSSSIIEMTSAVRQIKGNSAILATDTAATATLVSNMDSAIKQIVAQAADASSIAEAVRKDAEEGWKAVDATISGINEIKLSSTITFNAIENLSKRVANIGKILSVIDEVAEQTNLLALNASIIAAQAGARGKSFSVVALEIKNLAKRTGNHTKEISEIILGVEEEMARAVTAITNSEKRITEGSELSQKSGSALRKIVDGIQVASSYMVEINKTALSQADASIGMQQAMDRVAEMVEQIAHATREQSHGSELITSAVERMRGLTREVIQSIGSHQNSAAQVVNSSEEINNMVVEICEASILLATNSQQVSNSLNDFETSTEAQVASTLQMDEILLQLMRQISVLQNEMEQFQAQE
jgi:methyl-accepting chemotaxis protein